MTAGGGGQVWSTGLQLERTSLAWRRLALALLALSLALPRLGWQVMGPWTLAPACVVAAGAITLLATSHRRYLSAHRALTAGTDRPLPDGRLIMTTVLSAAVLAAVALLILILQAT
jgi:uncharacterized membrane protein YidH (DUF202 family)